MGYLTAYALKDGKALWRFQSGKRIVGTPAVSEGIVVFGSADCKNIRSECSKRKLIVDSESLRTRIGGSNHRQRHCYIGASDHTFRAINTSNGEIKWTFTGVKGYIETKPLVTDSKIIFGAWDNTLYALNKADGRELWKWTGGLTRMHFSPAAVWPVAAEGKVFITTRNAP